LVGPPSEEDGDPWYFSLNNRRLWVLKQLREEGLLPEGRVKVRWRQPKSKAETERYTVANCSLEGHFVREKAKAGAEGAPAGPEEEDATDETEVAAGVQVEKRDHKNGPCGWILPVRKFEEEEQAGSPSLELRGVPPTGESSGLDTPPRFLHESYTQNVEWDHRGSLAAAQRFYEGFWDEKREPNPTEHPWPARLEWVDRLLDLEDRCRSRCLTAGWDSNSLFVGESAKVCFIRTHGSADCRVCGGENWTGTYYWPERPATATPDDEVVMWPEGYAHYILEHKQVPSKAFYHMVLDATRKGKRDAPWPPGLGAALAGRDVQVGAARRAELGGLAVCVEGLRLV